jgi:hypothetical protein
MGTPKHKLANFTELKQLFFPLLPAPVRLRSRQDCSPALKTMGYWEVPKLDRLAEKV